jgi:hypothetical protein
MAVALTEDQWLTTTDTAVLWESDDLWGKVSARKYQLYAVAWCRRIWDLFPTDQARRVVETLERVADGLADHEELEIAWRLATEGEGDPHAGLSEVQSYALSAALTCCRDKGYRLAGVAASYCLAAMAAQVGRQRRDYEAEGRAQCDIIREFFPNPFRLPTLDPSWLTGNVVGLGQAACDGPEFELLPVLADALEDAGCENTEMLEHCRGAGEHVRGCWLVDLILGKQ